MLICTKKYNQIQFYSSLRKKYFYKTISFSEKNKNIVTFDCLWTHSIWTTVKCVRKKEVCAAKSRNLFCNISKPTIMYGFFFDVSNYCS